MSSETKCSVNKTVTRGFVIFTDTDNVKSSPTGFTKSQNTKNDLRKRCNFFRYIQT